jgi:DNA-binding transcriptional LysR family regulator
MDTRFLETLVTVAEQQSLAKAAHRLNLTPAAVAQRVKALEAEFGVKLLARSGRVVRPTAAGFRILERARQLLRDVQILRATANAGAASGELRIGAINTALAGMLPQILQEFSERYPQAALFVQPGVSMDLYADVLSGKLDAAIIVEPRSAVPKTLLFVPLRVEPMVLIAPAHLAGSDPVAVLSSQPFIRYDRNNWGGRLADESLRLTGVAPQERYELDSLEAITVMVARGLGVSIIPDWAPPWPAGIDIVKLQMPAGSPPRTVGLAASRVSPSQTLIGALVSVSTEVGRRQGDLLAV